MSQTKLLANNNDGLFENPVDFNMSQTAVQAKLCDLSFENPVDFNMSQPMEKAAEVHKEFENPVDFNMSQTCGPHSVSAGCLRTLWILICLKPSRPAGAA